MPRAARKDQEVTKLLRANKLLLDPRSFVSLPAHFDGKPHLYLEGLDVVLMRLRVELRDKGKCKQCKSVTETWEMDHLQGGTVGRCDCLHNLQTLCGRCHDSKHVSVQWGPGRAQGLKDFDEVHND